MGASQASHVGSTATSRYASSWSCPPESLMCRALALRTVNRRTGTRLSRAACGRSSRRNAGVFRRILCRIVRGSSTGAGCGPARGLNQGRTGLVRGRSIRRVRSSVGSLLSARLRLERGSRSGRHGRGRKVKLSGKHCETETMVPRVRYADRGYVRHTAIGHTS